MRDAADARGRARPGPVRGVGPALLLAGNAGHADIPLDAPGSGLIGLLMTMLGQTVGFPVPEGGAGRLAEALAARFTSPGGEVHCDAEVIGIEVRAARATGVRTATERMRARRAVVADVAAPHLYGRLLDADDVPARVARGMTRFQMDPGTVKVDWALSGPVPWLTEPAYAPGTVHVADSVGQMHEALRQVRAGAIPAGPFMLAGQMTTTDPTRSPSGTESFWAYTHVPQQTRDGRGPRRRCSGTWDRDDCERFADRMQARLERLAPGFGATDPGPAGARAARARGTQRQPDRRRRRRRHRPAAPGAGLPTGPGTGPGRDRQSAASTSARPPRTRAAACTAPPAATPPGRRCCTTGYDWAVTDRRVISRSAGQPHQRPGVRREPEHTTIDVDARDGLEEQLDLSELAAHGLVAEVDEHQQRRPRCIVNTRAVSSARRRQLAERRVGELGQRTAQRGQAPVDRQEYGVPTPVELRPVQLRALEGLRVLRVGDDGTGPSPSARTPRSAPRRSPCPSSGSGCEVKNWNGVDAAHSSPMNSIGVNGPHRVSSAAQASWSSSRCSVEPVAARRGCRPGRGSGCTRRAARSAGARCRSAAPWSRPRNDE